LLVVVLQVAQLQLDQQNQEWVVQVVVVVLIQILLVMEQMAPLVIQAHLRLRLEALEELVMQAVVETVSTTQQAQQGEQMLAV
jgi:hypothetical protein